MMDLNWLRAINKKAVKREKQERIRMSCETHARYRKEMNNILKWGGSKEEQLNAFIQLVEEILEE